MNFFSNQRTWFFIALFFIVVNMVLILGFFLHKGRGRAHGHGHNENVFHGNFNRGNMHGGPAFLHAAFIADTLGFNAAQKSSLEKIESELSAVKDSIFEQSESCKQNFNKELYALNPDRTRLDSLTACISSATVKFNRLRIEKILRIRALCTAEQLEKLSTILREMTERRAGHGNFNERR